MWKYQNVENGYEKIKYKTLTAVWDALRQRKMIKKREVNTLPFFGMNLK